MKCIICGSTISSRSKKCPSCGAAANISRGDFLFEFCADDQKQLFKHYNAWKEKTAAEAAGKEAEVKAEPITKVNSGTLSADKSVSAKASNVSQARIASMNNASRTTAERRSETLREHSSSSSEQNSWFQTVPYEPGSNITTIRFSDEARSALSRERIEPTPTPRVRRSFSERMSLLGRWITNFIRVIFAVICSVVMGGIIGILGIALVMNIADKNGGNVAFSAIFFIVIAGGLIFLYRLLFNHLDYRDLLNTAMRCELIIVPLLLITVLIGGAVAVEKTPSLKYSVAEYMLEVGAVYDARETFEELGTYEDSQQRVKDIIAMYPTTIKGGDTVIFGAYEQDNNPENGKEPIEWLSVYEIGYDGYVTLISKNALDYKYFDKNDWENSSLRHWLNGEFLSEAFSEQEQAMLNRTGGFLADTVDIWLAINKDVPDQIRKSVPSEYALSKGSEEFRWCFRETEGVYPAQKANTVMAAYVDSIGKVSSGIEEGSFYVRPVIRLRTSLYESVLGYAKKSPDEWYGTDFSGIEKTFTGTYTASQGITGVDLTILDCDEYGNIEAEFNFYEHHSNPGVPSGKYLLRGSITDVDDNGNISIVMNGYKWIECPEKYNMLDFNQIIIDSQHRHITGAYGIDVTAY